MLSFDAALFVYALGITKEVNSKAGKGCFSGSAGAGRPESVIARRGDGLLGLEGSTSFAKGEEFSIV